MEKKNTLFGLTEDVCASLRHIFEKIDGVNEVLVFGSRAKGTYTSGSDIDIVLKGKDISFDTILTVMSEIENLQLLYRTDVLNYNTIKDQAVLEHIDRVGQTLWKRKSITNTIS
jgi:predicted nucleotidyltransferase